jgi:hypothetical protein
MTYLIIMGYRSKSALSTHRLQMCLSREIDKAAILVPVSKEEVGPPLPSGVVSTRKMSMLQLKTYFDELYMPNAPRETHCEICFCIKHTVTPEEIMDRLQPQYEVTHVKEPALRDIRKDPIQHPLVIQAGALMRSNTNTNNLSFYQEALQAIT